MKSRTSKWLCLLLATLAAVQQGQAQPPREETRVPPRETSETVPGSSLLETPAENTAISRRQASELAQEAYEGRVLGMRLERGQWRIRMDEDGIVFNVLVDAQTGKVTRPE